MDEKIGPQPLVRPSPAPIEKMQPRGRTRGRRGVLILVVIGVLVAALGAGYWWKASRAPRVHYLTTAATRGDVTKVVNATGTVNPVMTIIVGAYVSGNIQEVFCDYNTLVKAGQICAKIDPRPFKAVFDQYTGQLERDRAALAQAKMNLARYQKLAEQNSIARQQAEDQFYIVRQGEGIVKLDKALVDGAKLNLAYTDIVSPVDGVVVSRAVTRGQTVASSFQTPTLFLIATDLTNMQVDTTTSESDIGNVKPGNAVTFTVDAYPKRVFRGSIAQVRQSPQTVQNVVTFDAVVGVDNKDLALMPGMTASTRIVVASRHDVLRVPNQALRYVPGALAAQATLPKAGGAAQLWVLRGKTPRAIKVVPGLEDDNFTEIKGGDLRPGDAVIIGEERGTAAARQQRIVMPRL